MLEWWRPGWISGLSVPEHSYARRVGIRLDLWTPCTWTLLCQKGGDQVRSLDSLYLNTIMSERWRSGQISGLLVLEHCYARRVEIGLDPWIPCIWTLICQKGGDWVRSLDFLCQNTVMPEGWMSSWISRLPILEHSYARRVEIGLDLWTPCTWTLLCQNGGDHVGSLDSVYLKFWTLLC